MKALGLRLIVVQEGMGLKRIGLETFRKRALRDLRLLESWSLQGGSHRLTCMEAALVGLAIFILYDAYDLTFLMLGIPGPSKIFQKE